ncbi:hypothetical protein TIFTF001_030481 [Ficus carica]|uniref:Uncharacterized protein n=1 Tax=Ficus carica TaxID=3494 RepID=A0AA88DTW4_FICCA|nr:hypothetical protein TIFTF001_030481 [Ficus carica]
MVPAATPTVNGYSGVLSGPECSGQPDRIDRLGYPVDISRWMVPVADRYRSKAGVSCEKRGLVQKTHAGTSSTTRIQVLGERSALNTAERCRRCRNMVGVLENKQLPERRTLVPRVVGVTCRWCHVSHHHEREGKATLRTLKFQISN